MTIVTSFEFSMSKKRNYKVTWAEAFTEVFTMAMRTGQLFPLALVVLLVIVFLRVSEVTLSLFLIKIASGLENTYLGVGFFFLDTNRLVYSR